MNSFLFFLKETATTKTYTEWIVGSVRWVKETGYEVHKFPAMPVDKQIHLATRIV